ncbi:sacsin-like isoform X2 [Struthio camelus]|uniref:sacsin-like isoform X2 n=1 Tax=Struthio camelus TaxID=8801 RepID=UPI00360418C5
MALRQPKAEAFCQQAPIFLDYLRSILQKYPDGGQILKELVQNADDAGATEVVFMLDEREFDVIVGGGLEGTQDLPGVLSPPFLAVLDPECRVLPGAGARWDISAAQDLPGLFEPFWAGLEAMGQCRGSAQGTLFRFPFRQQPSGIAVGVSNPGRLHGLLQTFLAEAPLALLFLRHVRHVALHHVSPDGAQTLMGTLVASPRPLPVLEPAGTMGLSLTWRLVALCRDGIGDEDEWLVATGRATSGAAVELGARIGCSPELSLAHHLHGACQGRLCCFLPLPATEEMATGLPAHVSAPFALSDDRCHLRWASEDGEGEEDASWNALLLLDLLPRVYGHVAAMAATLPGTDPYGIWPDPEHAPRHGRIREVVANVCRELAAARALVPAAEGAPGLLQATEAVLLLEDMEDTATQQVVQAFLVAAGEPVAVVPAHVQRALALGLAKGLQEATAGHVREVLRCHGDAGLLASDRLCLLRYVAADGCYAKLQGLPLLPRADGTFVAFGNVAATVYVDTSDCPRVLLPGLAGLFLPPNLEPALDNLLQDIAKAGLFPNLVLLDPAMTARTLHSALPPTWTSQSSSLVTWCPAHGPPQPPAPWLPALWLFLANHMEDLGPVEGLPLVPLSLPGAPRTRLAPLIPQSGLIFQVWEDQCLPPTVAPILEALGCPVVPPGIWHRSLSRYILPPSPLNALRALGMRRAEDVASRLASLPAAAVDTLRLYLADVPSLAEPERAILATLPLFIPLPCLATPQPTGLVPASATPALEPELELPRDVVLPKTMLWCRDEADRQLLGRLQKSFVSAAYVALEGIRAVAQGAYAGRAAEAQGLLFWVLQHGDTLFAQSPPLQQACSNLAFLETPSGPVHPRDLYDPCESTLQVLLGPEHFPPASFCTPLILRALRVLGLRHGKGCLVPSDILEAATTVSQGGGAALDKAKALIKVCNHHKALAGFSAMELRQLCALPWVPRSECTGKPEQPFLPPKDLRSIRYMYLVGLAMPLTGVFTLEAEEKLGLCQAPPPERVWEQLRCLAGCRDTDKVVPALRAIYQHMQEDLGTFGAAPEGAVVWTGAGFVLPGDAVLGYPEELDLEALVPRVPPDFLPYSCLFRAWGVEARVSEERVVTALRCLGQTIDARSSGSGTEAELKVAVAVLEWLKNQGHRAEGMVPVPVRVPEGSGFTLRPAASAVYLDMELEAEEDMQEVVHEAVQCSTAAFLGTELLSTRVLGPEPFTACGPSEPITLRLRNILQEYCEEGDLFTEMVQNAEDAGATDCRFLLDLRQCRKAITGLLDPGMAACHGPALWAYNNALFTEDDLRNITRVGAATKKHQSGRIGRFGLGFNCVYRITDVPAVLSGATLLIFDPNGTHLGNHIPKTGCPGIRLDFSTRPRILRAFAEQFRPYQGIFGCHLPEPGAFPGTLFRLPFRTEEEAVTSQICSEAFGTERIRSLGTSFIGSSRLLLLFLRRVKEISLEMLPDMATSPEDAVSLAILQRKEIRDLGAPGDPPSWAAIEQLTAHEKTSKTTWHYLVLVCQGDGESLELFHQRTQAGLHNLPPMAGVALPLALTADGKWVPRMGAEEGQVFCHLPMPVASGLPIHVHGAFSILSNRKGLWDTAEQGEWNRALLRDAVPAAWLRALAHLRTLQEAGELKSYEYHVFWPDISAARFPFTEAVACFYQVVAARNGPRLFSDGCSWCPLQDARFLHRAVARHPKLGAVAERVFATTLSRPLLAVALPERVQRGLGKAVAAGTYDWPRFYCELVLPNLEDLSVADRDPLLLHALDMSHDDVDKVLQTVPCIPATPHGHLQLISHLVHPRGRAASLYNPKDGRFPCGDAFLSPERLGRLEQLGMVRDLLALPELLEQAKTVKHIWTQDHAQGCRKAACILELLQDAVEQGVNNIMQAAFRTVPFLPGTLPTGEHVLLPAAQLYHHLHAPLVGLIHPVLAHKVLGKDFSLSEEVASFLGLDRQLPAAAVLQQLQALSHSSNALPAESLQDTTHCCYAYLDTLLKREHTSWGEVAAAVAQGEPFILVDSHFVPATAVAETLPFEAVPYLYQLPAQYRPYSQLWECVGLRHTFTWSDYARVLRILAEKHAGEPLPAPELALALRLISCGLMTDGEEPDAYQTQQLFLPDHEGILRPRDKLHFNDTPWLPVGKGAMLCHEQLAWATALRCGVPTTRHQALEKSRLLTANLSLWAQPFGAREDLPTRLKNILGEYPASTRDVVMELLQNADDAGAGTVHFVWDRRQHPVDATFSEAWNTLQGPALCIYNDSPLQQQDIEGIQRLGVGGKQGRQDVTGKFGLGFNTVFHLTDCPAFLTGDSALCVFDPHLTYVPGATTESPGGMFAVNPEFKRTFPDVYGTFLPSLFDLSQGVLFRLPLRTAAGATSSKVSGMVVRDQDLVAMQTTLVEEGGDLVLFLRHLHTVIFSEIPMDGGPLVKRLQVAIELAEEDAELRRGFQARLSHAVDGDGPISVSYIMKVKTSKATASTVWRVTAQIGVQKGAEESPVPGRMPYGAVAACLKPLALENPMGKAFCTLPLPLTTGLPVHINANFSVDAARRGFHQDPGSTEAAWNGFLLRCLVAPVYCTFLTKQWRALGPEQLQFSSLNVCQQHLTPCYLRFFPAVTNSVPPTWHELVRDIYRHLSHTRLPLVPVCHVKLPDTMVTMAWASPGGRDALTEPYFLEREPESPLRDVLQHLDMNLVPAFAHLWQIYQELRAAGVAAVALQPASLRCFLKALALPLPCLLAETPLRTPKSCSILLQHCLEPTEDVRTELEGLPLLAMQDGCLRALSTHQPVLCSSFAYLFPHHSHSFANSLVAVMAPPGFVQDLGLPEATPLIQEALGQLDWTTEGQKWLKGLWDFFDAVIYKATQANKEKLEAAMNAFIDHLQDAVLLPVQRHDKDSKCTLVPLSSLPNVLYDCDRDVAKVLHKLGIPVLQKFLLPFHFAYHCLKPRALQATKPTAVLAWLANTVADLCWRDLEAFEVTVLLRFFTQERLDWQALEHLRHLPLFQNHSGDHVAVAPYRKVMMFNSQFPKMPPGAQALYSLEKDMLLLKEDLIHQQLARHLGWEATDDRQLFMTVVLPRLPQLTALELVNAVQLFLTLQHAYEGEFGQDAVAAFQTVAFIPDSHGTLHQASYFYDNSPSLCTLQLQHRFVPEFFFKALGANQAAARTFMLQAGVRTSLSAEDFVVLALEIEREASQTEGRAEELPQRQEEMFKQLVILLDTPLPKGFLEQIASIHFLSPLAVPQCLRELHPPFAACTQPVTLKGSVYYDFQDVAELLWTSATILPLSDIPEKKLGLLKAIGVLVEIPTALVVANLEQVCRAACWTPEQMDTRTKVLQKMYNFLQSRLKEVDAGRLAELPVVLTKMGGMATPQQVVTSLPDEVDFHPYLLVPDPLMAFYRDLLKHLGVAPCPTLAHYSHVLAQIYQDSQAKGTLHAIQKKTVLLATWHLFQLLQETPVPPDFSAVPELYLLSTADCLEPSHKLFFNDCVSSRTYWALRKTFVFMAELPRTGFNWHLLQKLPQRLRPRALSEVLEQRLEEGSLQPCRYGPHCQEQKRLQTLLVSPWFRMGLEALLQWQSHRGMMRMEESSGFTVEQLEVQCCEDIRTVLVHCGAKVEGSSQSRAVHVCLAGGARRLIYLRHAETRLDRHHLRALEMLVQVINELLGGQLAAPALSVLREMLVCQEPQDVASVLEENDVALADAAPEP